jgi:hypothetical protein
VAATNILVANLAAINADMGLITAGEIRVGTGDLGIDYTGWRMWVEGEVGVIGGYDNDVLQWYSDTDGKLYAGGGNIIIDEAGLKVIGDFLSIRYTAGTPLGSIYAYSSSQLNIESSGTILISPTGELRVATLIPATDGLPPEIPDATVGTSAKPWEDIWCVTLHYRYLDEFKKYDDLQLMRNMIPKLITAGDKSKNVIDIDSLPPEVKSVDGKYLNAGAVQGLALSALKALVLKVDELAEEVNMLRKGLNGKT